MLLTLGIRVQGAAGAARRQHRRRRREGRPAGPGDDQVLLTLGIRVGELLARHGVSTAGAAEKGLLDLVMGKCC